MGYCISSSGLYLQPPWQKFGSATWRAFFNLGFRVLYTESHKLAHEDMVCAYGDVEEIGSMKIPLALKAIALVLLCR